MKTSRILHAARSHWVVLLVVAGVGLLCGLGRVALSAPRYSATASLLVSAADPDEGTDQTYQSSVATAITDSMSTYSSLTTSGLVLNEVNNRLGLGESSTELAKQVSATVPLGTAIVEVTATGDNAEAASRLADTTVAVLGEQITSSGMKQVTGSPALKTVTIGNGSDAVTEAGPSPVTNGALGLAAGLVIGCLITLALEPAPRRGRDSSGNSRDADHQEVVEFS